MADHLESEEEEDDLVPATRVLAIASHVVYGYVGNTMATLCMQTLGCEVAALNTVNFSNHTGYGQWTGSRTSPEAIAELYRGLQQSNLTDFDVLLTGYIPSAAALQEVASIAHDLKLQAAARQSKFFWVLDPVMGDQGKLYVSEEMVKGYKNIISRGEPDLVLPNGFELELISGVSLTGDGTAAGDLWEVDLRNVKDSIRILHMEYGIRMVVVTSVRVKSEPNMLCVIGSEMKSDGQPRTFVVRVPALDCYFSGTGDMFAGLMVGRLREMHRLAGHGDVWQSPDTTPATELPLAKATVKVLSSMAAVLERTMDARNEELSRFERSNGADEYGENNAKGMHLMKMKAAEVRCVRNARYLRRPHVCFQVEELV